MMNRERISDRQLQDKLLVLIAKNEPVELRNVLEMILGELEVQDNEIEHQTWRLRVLLSLEKLHKSSGRINAFLQDNDELYEFNGTLIDPPLRVLLETTANGRQRLRRLSKSPSAEDELREKVAVTIKTVREQFKESEFSKSHSQEKTIEKIAKAIAQRRGQKEFREDLQKTYKKCLITGCDAEEALEAAHIRPYSGGGTFEVPNGLLLRADIHTLFDLGLIAVDTDMTVIIAPVLENTHYSRFAGKKLRFPKGCSQRPDEIALKEHRKEAGM